jgi:hypothetical protein
MLLIQPQLPPTIAEVRPLWGAEFTPTAQGLEGRRLQEALIDVLRHWDSRSNGTLSDSAEVAPAEYQHVPFRTVGAIRVHYQAPERLRPRRIVLDDDAT